MKQPNTFIWAKPRNGPPSACPLICHLLNTGAVAEALWSGCVGTGFRQHVVNGLCLPDCDARRWVSFLASLSNIGKVTPSFQKKLSSGHPGLCARGAVNHE
ncbi:MAG: hypothetical protein J7M19_02020 [Planctomycetes bacterium]|nr:hypothetical protein [Planctomycetota bacterium]